MPRVRRKVPKDPVGASGPMMQAPAVVHWGKGIPPDKLAYINDREEALIQGARKFKGKRDVGGIPAYPDPGDTAAGDEDKTYGSGTSTGWGGAPTGSPSTSGTSTNWGGAPSTGSPSTSGTSTGWGGAPSTGSSSYGSGTSTGWGGAPSDGGLLGGGGIGAGSGSSGGSPSDGGGVSAGGFGGMSSGGGLGSASSDYPARGDYQGAVPSAAADIMAAARTLAPGVGATPAQRQQYDRWRAEIGQRAINGFPDPAPEKTDREISIPTPGPAAIAPLGVQPGLSAPPAAPAVASTSSAPAGPPEGLLGPRSMSYGTQTSNFDVPVQSIANTAAMTQPKIVDRIAPVKSGFGQSYASASSRSPYPSRGNYQGAYPTAEAAQPGPADIPAPATTAQYPSRGDYGVDPMTGFTPTPNAFMDMQAAYDTLAQDAYGSPVMNDYTNNVPQPVTQIDAWHQAQLGRYLNGWEDPKPQPELTAPPNFPSFGEDWRNKTYTGRALSGLLDALPNASTAGPGMNPPVNQSPSTQRDPNLPTAELTPLTPQIINSAMPPATVGSLAPQMSNISRKTEKLMQVQKKGTTPAGLDPFAMTEFDVPAEQDAVTDPRVLAGAYPSRGTPDPNASAYTGTPEQQVAANPSATSTPWGGYFDIPARTAGTTLPKNPLTGNLMDLRKQVLSSVRDKMTPVVGDTTVADTQPPPDGLLEGPRMGDVTPPPNDYFDTARPPATRMAFAARGDGGGVRQEALDNQKKALGGKKGGKKDDKPDDGTGTPGKGPRSRWNLPDWYWQWYRTAGQFGAPRGLLG